MSTVLAINDNAINLLLIEHIVIRAGITDNFLTAADGQKALEYYENLDCSDPHVSYPKLIFLDLNMPVMNGWEFLDKFIHTYLPFFNDTKVVITTSSLDIADSERAKKYPCVIDYKTTHLTVEYVQKLF